MARGLNAFLPGATVANEELSPSIRAPAREPKQADSNQVLAHTGFRISAFQFSFLYSQPSLRGKASFLPKSLRKPGRSTSLDATRYAGIVYKR